MMNYEIVDASAETGSLVVRFFTDDYPEGLRYSVDLPVPYPTGETLDAHIRSFAPVGQIARLVAIKNSGEAFPFSSPLQADPILDATLDDAKAFAEKKIDGEASKARARFVSSGIGQDGTYITKAEQAQAYRNAGYTGTVPPYVAAEALATGSTAQETADLILATRDAWNNTVGPNIEAARIGSKKKVRAATTNQGVDAELRAATLALQAIHP